MTLTERCARGPQGPAKGPGAGQLPLQPLRLACTLCAQRSAVVHDVVCAAPAGHCWRGRLPWMRPWCGWR